MARTARIFPTLGLLFVTGWQLHAQAVASAQISGSVTDPSGAAVPNAKVTATQTDTGMIRSTLSGPDGGYVLPNLPVGPYRLETEVRGFATSVQTGIRLQVSDNISVHISLQVGQTNSEIRVAANASMLQTETTSLTQVVDQRSVVDLPLNGRQATQLVLLSGGATNTPAANSDVMASSDLKTSKNYFSSDTISVAGGQSNGTNYLLDGGDNNDSFSSVNLPFPFPDAIQEFSVQTNSLSARFGLHPGAVVSVVTKSGTNQYHGDVFEFVRNGDFNARDFFAPTQDSLKRNQFGGTLGAPILHDKLFGFFGYQGTRIRTAPPSSIVHVPTQAVSNGDFSQLESSGCRSTGTGRTLTNPATGQPFANNFVSPSLFNPQALNLLKYVPVSSDPCGTLTYAIPQPQGEDQYIGRVDWNQSARHNFFGRYFYSDYRSPASFDKNVLLSTQRGVLERSQTMTLGDTYSIGPKLVNSAHATFTRLAITRGPAADFINPTDLGVNMFSAVPNFLSVGVNGRFSAGCGTCAPAYFNRNAFQGADDLDFIHGRHHIALGADVIRNQLNFGNFSGANGAFTFNGQFTGESLVDFMLGLPSSFSQSGHVIGNYRQTYLGFYVEDSVRLSKRLNLQFGLRWEPYLPEKEIHNQGQNYFFPADFTAGKTSSVFVNAPPGFFFTGDAGIPHAFSFHKLADFEPRVGLVWDPTGSGRQTIRAGFGMFYDTPMIFYAQDAIGDAPWASSLSIPSPGGGFTNPYLGFPGGNPFPMPSPPPKNAAFVPEGAYYNYPIQPFPTYVHQWNVSYQRQLKDNWVITATYIGNKTTHIWTGEEVNPAVYIPGTCNGAPCSTPGNTNQRRILSLQNPVTGSMISDIWQMDPGSNSEYEGLVVSAQHRFSRQYTLLANYTWSHCVSDGDFEGDLGGPGTEQPFNRNADRGNCGFDIRQIFNLSFVAAMPRFSHPWMQRLAGNWQLAPIFSVHTGTWFSVWTGLDNSLTGIGLDRPNVIGNPYIRKTSTLQWLDPNAFVPNALGTFGNVGSDSLRGPGYFNIDVAVTRSFHITERHRLELRFEFFNILNHTNFANPDNQLQDSTFGLIQSDVAPRILQFAVKYSF